MTPSLARIDADAVAKLRRHPRFPDALRAVATTGVELYQGNRLLNAISNDRGRLFLGMFALYLHYTRRPYDPGSGLTGARLQSLFVEAGLGSAGRTKALIALMRWAGLLEEAPASRDRRVKALRPTEKMFAMHHARWRRALGAAALVLPDAAEGYARFDAPGFLPDHGPQLQLLSDRDLIRAYAAVGAAVWTFPRLTIMRATRSGGLGAARKMILGSLGKSRIHKEGPRKNQGTRRKSPAISMQD